MSDYSRSVFINCPFDKDYRQILLVLLFTVRSLGYKTKMALDENDCAKIRLLKITKLIEECRIGIHDLSRLSAQKKGEYYRLNMPFELGIDFAAKTLFPGNGRWKKKKLLILENEQWGYQKALSDLAGCDIRYHQNKAIVLIKCIRDWFVAEEKIFACSTDRIWSRYNDFNMYLYARLKIAGFRTRNYKDIKIPEIQNYLDEWLKEDKLCVIK